MSDLISESKLLQAIGLAVVAADAEGKIVFANDSAQEMCAISSDAMVGLSVLDVMGLSAVDSDAREGMTRVLAGQTWSGDAPVRRGDDTTFLARVTETPVLDDTGAVAGLVAVLEDITEVRLTAARLADQDQRLRLAHAAAALGTWQWDMTTDTVVWDEQLEEIFGLPPGGFDGTFEAWAALLHPDDREGVLADVGKALAAKSSFVVRHRIVRPDGAVAWVEGLGQATLGPDGEPTGMIGCQRDDAERVEAEQIIAAAREAEQASAARVEQLQRATADFAATGTVEQVGGVLHDHLRDWLGAENAGVYLADETTSTLRLTASYGYGDAIAAGSVVPLGETSGRGATDATGGVYVLTDPALGLRYPGLLKVSVRLGNRFPVGVLIPTKHGTPGILLLGFDRDPELTHSDAVLLAALAGQSAGASQRAKLLHRTSEIANQLQVSLAASSMPEVVGVELAAYYAPGGDELEHVGGDWYDAVDTDDGSVVLVVGDVMGRGVLAATTMIRIRAAIRGFITVDPTPEVVLAATDRLLERDAPDQFVTVMCAIIDPRRGRLSLCCAGHVPLILVSPDGRTETIGAGSGLPLGVSDGAPREVFKRDVVKGTTVVLVTDGVVERRDHDLDEGIGRLESLAARLHRAPLASLVTKVARLAGEHPDDDVTVFAARLM